MTTVADLDVPKSKAQLKKVTQVRFTVLSPDEIRQMSVAEVYNSNTYENGLPVHNGLNDPRMGPIDFRTPCETCNMNMDNCQGHFGHIELAQPMFSWGFLKTTLSCLRCVCHYCSRLLVDHEDLNLQKAMQNKNMKHRLHSVCGLCRAKKRCPFGGEQGQLMDSDDLDGLALQATGCGYLQPKYVQEGAQVYVVYPEEDQDQQVRDNRDRKRQLTGAEAYRILSKIPAKDKLAMGFIPGKSDPAWLILTAFPVPPPPVRPTVSFGTDRSEDDLTAKLIDLLRANLTLKQMLEQGSGKHVCQEFANLLQYHIYTLCDNNIQSLPQATTKSRKPIKSIRERLKGKEGRLRGHLMGKRVDFSARTVIGGDPMLDIDQVGVPRSIAFNLTFPERVTTITYKKLLQAVRNGPTEYPGARTIIRPDGTRVDLRFAPVPPAEDELGDGYSSLLNIGDKVERHMLDNDYVVFNRQPSLHKMSMMGHRAKILPYSTFRLNLSATSPYNADFDGDEMNLHLAQSHETRAEIKHIMLVPKQMVSPQGNKPVMGIVQDACLAVSKFTRRDTLMQRDMVYSLLLQLPDWDGRVPTPCILRPEPLWSGKQIFSLLLKPRLNVTKDNGVAAKNKSDNAMFSKSDHKCVIRDGEVVCGRVDKKIVGTQSGGVLHLTWLDHGPEACKVLISYIQKLVNAWLLHEGFTCGCADIVANDETMTRVGETLRSAKDKVAETVAKAQRGELDTQPGKTMHQSFEHAVNQSLNSAREEAGRIGSDSLDERNNIIAMVTCGSKGSNINVAQIIACVGQQNVEGKRIANGFRDRTLPHFAKDDYGPESRGFVENSYLAGLTPEELYFHAMGGREGVIDTAVKTSETGYIQRRLVKSMETLKVRYDGTVRNDNEDIVQFLYGEDGMDAVYIEDQDLDLMKMNHNQVDRKLRHNHLDEDYGKNWLLGEENRHWLRELNEGRQSGGRMLMNEEFELLQEYKRKLCMEIYPDGEAKQHLPVPIDRLVRQAQMIFQRPEGGARIDPRKDSYYTPPEIIEKVNHLMGTLETIKGLSETDDLGREMLENSMIVLNAHLRTRMNSRRLLEQDKLNKRSVDWLLGEVRDRFELALAQAGEMVGTIAAQSVGEPATQMTLNTFHFAGVGSKNVTLGVPRLKEIINVAKTVKTPSLTCYLNPDIAKNKQLAKNVQALIEHTTLEKITAFSQIFYDPEPDQTIVPEDREWVGEYYELPDEEDNRDRLSPWVLRIQLDNKVMTDKKLSMREVGERIINDFMGDLACIFTDDNADELVLRLRIVKENPIGAGLEEDEQGDDEDKDCRFLKNIERDILKDMVLKGVHGIRKVFMREENVVRYDDQTGEFPRRDKTEKEWLLDTEGCNLEEILQIEQIDSKRTTSNDVVEIMQVLGVEAVRKKLHDEVKAVISFDGAYVNYRHLAVLCDTMSNRGHLMAISRHGVNRADHGPLMKCSFEETVEMLMEAAMFGQVDHCKGVSENIILGQLPNIGTNEFDILTDVDALKDARPTVRKPQFGDDFDGDDDQDDDNARRERHEQFLSQQTPIQFGDDFTDKERGASAENEAKLAADRMDRFGEEGGAMDGDAEYDLLSADQPVLSVLESDIGSMGGGGSEMGFQFSDPRSGGSPHSSGMMDQGRSVGRQRPNLPGQTGSSGYHRHQPFGDAGQSSHHGSQQSQLHSGEHMQQSRIPRGHQGSGMLSSGAPVLPGSSNPQMDVPMGSARSGGVSYTPAGAASSVPAGGYQFESNNYPSGAPPGATGPQSSGASPMQGGATGSRVNRPTYDRSRGGR
eukprot:g4726.t1